MGRHRDHMGRNVKAGNLALNGLEVCFMDRERYSVGYNSNTSMLQLVNDRNPISYFSFSYMLYRV